MADSPNSSKKETRWYQSWAFIILFCLIVPFGIRSIAIAPFHIPSGSMKPNLLVGDYIFVSKFAYGYSRYSFPFSIKWFDGRIGLWSEPDSPERGDIVVFRLPSNPRVDYVKRLVGLPGDKIQVRNGILYINDRMAKRQEMAPYEEEERNGRKLQARRYLETLPYSGAQYEVLEVTPNGALDNTTVYEVPAGHYFLIGDNRDRSQDSRVLGTVGYVPEENLVGRADIIFFSLESAFWKFWHWVDGFRTSRFIKLTD